MSLTIDQVRKLEYTAYEIRKSIVDTLIEAKSGHTAGALGLADIFTYLYFHELKHDPKKPNWEYRDRLVLSNGHTCPVLYATLAHAGYFPLAELKTLRQFGSRLQGHPHREFLPYVETSSGPLGSGLSQTVGMSIANRIDSGRKSSMKFYCIMSDGELDEGNSWEAIMLAGKERIGNLTVILDRNNIQIDGYTKDVMPLEPLRSKWESFNWHVQEIDGHDFNKIDQAVSTANSVSDKPSVIIARTIPSKSIPEFEGKFEWHGKPPLTREEIEIARRAFKEGRTLGGRISSPHHE